MVVKENLGAVTNPLAVSLVIVPDSTWYLDADADGFGDVNFFLVQCIQPVGYVLDNTDCDDGDLDKYPGGPAIADGKDNNCDGQVDPSEDFGDTIKPVITIGAPLPIEITKGDGQINASIKATDNSGSLIVTFHYKEVSKSTFTTPITITADASQDYIQTIMETWLNELAKRNVLHQVYILIGITPLKSLKMAHILANVPGVYIPANIMQRMEIAERSGNAQEEGVQVSLELISRIKK